MGSLSEPFISIVMPALNEERYIGDAIKSVSPETGVDYELLVLDGGSTDRTRAIVQGLAEQNRRIRLITNERRTQAAAMNLAAAMADPRSRVLVRADCHCAYPAGYIARCTAMLRDREAASIVVSMHTRGRTCLQRGIAHAQNTVLGNGGSAHRTPGRSGYVDHGHHAAFDRDAFMELGGYDETFTHNEDAEFDTRLTRSGRRIYLDDLSVDYFPRADFASLARQYFNFGRGRANTMIRHRARPKLRQVLPVIALLGCVGSVLLSAVHVLFLAPVVFYSGVCLSWGLVAALRNANPCLLAAGPAAMVMHMSWGAGFLTKFLHWSARQILPSSGVSAATTTQSGRAPLLRRA